MTVFSSADVVVAHKTVPGNVGKRQRNVDAVQYQAILMHLVAAWCGTRCD